MAASEALSRLEVLETEVGFLTGNRVLSRMGIAE